MLKIAAPNKIELGQTNRMNEIRKEKKNAQEETNKRKNEFGSQFIIITQLQDR